MLTDIQQQVFELLSNNPKLTTESKIAWCTRIAKTQGSTTGNYIKKLINNHKDFVSFGNLTPQRVVEKAKQKVNSAKSKVLQDIARQFTDKELEAIANGGRIIPGLGKVPVVDFSGKRIRFAISGDWHLGSSYTYPDHILKMFDLVKKEGCEFLTVGGDVTEGMSNRPGHVYELSHIGYDKQKEHAIEILEQSPVPTYLIDGNHDRWFIKNSGALIVKDVCKHLNSRLESDKYIYLGHDEGDISLAGKATLKLWHGEDGNSYAHSYRLQKIIESLTGGTKPNIMAFHHTHKFAYIFDRHIHCVSAGGLQTQTKWMRGKRIAAHTGFVIADAVINKDGVASLSVKWCPFYT